LIAVAAGEDGSRHGGGGAVATRMGEVMDTSSVDSSDDEKFSVHSSVHSAKLYGDGVCDSPNFDEHNDPMHDSPMDNKVSKYSFYSCLTHYMEGLKISESNRTAVELCLLSEAGAFVRNMDPMKKDKKERFFLLSISPSSMKLRMTSSRTQRIKSVRICAKCIRVLRK
jgi:ribosomal protein L28